MKRRSFLSSSATLLAGSFLGSRDSQAEQTHAVHHDHSAASLMTECANRFLAALDENQRGKAAFPFEADERMNWHYVPNGTRSIVDTLGERKGLTLREMTPYQKHLASALLAAGLSQIGYIKALTIMSLEDVLRVMENDAGERRNPEKYYFSIFGSPSLEPQAAVLPGLATRCRILRSGPLLRAIVASSWQDHKKSVKLGSPKD